MLEKKSSQTFEKRKMENVKQRSDIIKHGYAEKRRKIEERTRKLRWKYESKIVKDQMEMEKLCETLKKEEEKALELMETQMMKKLVSDNLLNGITEFEDTNGYKWEADKIEWSEGKYTINRDRYDHECYPGSGSYVKDDVKFTPDMIQAQLEDNNISLTKAGWNLCVSILPPDRFGDGYILSVTSPKMIFKRKA